MSIGQGHDQPQFRRIKVWTYRSAAGRVEEIHVYQDERGNEKKCVRRQIGDKYHQVTMNRDAAGTEDRIDEFENMTSYEKSSFDTNWMSHSAIDQVEPNLTLSKMLTPEDSTLNTKDNRLFWRLFRAGFDGFPSVRR